MLGSALRCELCVQNREDLSLWPQLPHAVHLLQDDAKWPFTEHLVQVTTFHRAPQARHIDYLNVSEGCLPTADEKLDLCLRQRDS